MIGTRIIAVPTRITWILIVVVVVLGGGCQCEAQLLLCWQILDSRCFIISNRSSLLQYTLLKIPCMCLYERTVRHCFKSLYMLAETRNQRHPRRSRGRRTACSDLIIGCLFLRTIRTTSNQGTPNSTGN